MRNYSKAQRDIKKCMMFVNVKSMWDKLLEKCILLDAKNKRDSIVGSCYGNYLYRLLFLVALIVWP